MNFRVPLAAFMAALSLHSASDIHTSTYTTALKNNSVFLQPYSGLNDDEEDIFMLGKSFFRIPWVEAPSATTARDGLGPLFSANTCVTCHPKNGTGAVYTKQGSVSRALVTRLSIAATGSEADRKNLKRNGFIPEPTYGAQLSVNGVHGVPFEGKPALAYEKSELRYGDGDSVTLHKPVVGITEAQYGALHEDAVIANRLAPALVGLGLLEQISDDQILEREDIGDRNGDGISGKANRVFNPLSEREEIGRYTWKASAPTVKHQVAAAMLNDMGLTNPIFQNENCTDAQDACKKAPQGRDTFDVPMMRLDAVTFYVTHLKTPRAVQDERHMEGQKVFNTIGCSSCHTPSYELGNGYTITPYSDLLLHDMGAGLADGRREFDATGREWRTPPLWGIGHRELALGQKPEYLHDGRAKSLEEAIVWHGGEAEAAKNAFMKLSKRDREKIIRFLEGL